MTHDFVSSAAEKGENGVKLEKDEQTNGVTYRKHSTSIRIVEYF